MSSYVFMKILESVPQRYDLGIKLLSLGKIQKVKEQIAGQFASAQKSILEIGCGTGTLALLCAQRGAKVIGFDTSAAMLAVAQEKLKTSYHGVKWVNCSLLHITLKFLGEVRDEHLARVMTTAQEVADHWDNPPVLAMGTAGTYSNSRFVLHE